MSTAVASSCRQPFLVSEDGAYETTHGFGCGKVIGDGPGEVVDKSVQAEEIVFGTRLGDAVRVEEELITRL